MTLVKTYARCQLAMLADGSRLLYRKEEEEAPDWVDSADTRKMTLAQYKQFIQKQMDAARKN